MFRQLFASGIRVVNGDELFHKSKGNISLLSHCNLSMVYLLIELFHWKKKKPRLVEVESCVHVEWRHWMNFKVYYLRFSVFSLVIVFSYLPAGEPVNYYLFQISQLKGCKAA